MSVKIYKPTTPGQRGMTGSSFEEITKTKPEKNPDDFKIKKVWAKYVWPDYCPTSRWRQQARKFALLISNGKN